MPSQSERQLHWLVYPHRRWAGDHPPTRIYYRMDLVDAALAEGWRVEGPFALVTEEGS